MSELKTKKLFVNEASEKDINDGWTIEIKVGRKSRPFGWIGSKSDKLFQDVVGIPSTAFGDLMIVEVNENCEHISDIIHE